MDEEIKQLLREIRDDLKLIRENLPSVDERRDEPNDWAAYARRKERDSQFSIIWPLLALVEKWKHRSERMVEAAKQEEGQKDKLKAALAYKETAKELEAWIKTGALGPHF